MDVKRFTYWEDLPLIANGFFDYGSAAIRDTTGSLITIPIDL